MVKVTAMRCWFFIFFGGGKCLSSKIEWSRRLTRGGESNSPADDFTFRTFPAELCALVGGGDQSCTVPSFPLVYFSLDKRVIR